MIVTISVPKKRLRPILRLGFFISPAIKVTLFQASLLKIDPTIATATAPASTSPLIGFQLPLLASNCVEVKPVFQLADQKLSFTKRKPNMINPNKASNLAEVNNV